MNTCARTLVALAGWAVLGGSPAAAQVPGSGAAARELTALLDARKLESIATRLPDTPDTFAAALYVPGQQLILVSGRYAAPSLLREKIILGRYRDAYVDLFGAADPASRRVVEDLGADGLHAAPGKGEPSDLFTRPAAAPVRFDGNWKAQKITREAYDDLFQRADARYTEIVAALVAALKRSAPPSAQP